MTTLCRDWGSLVEKKKVVKSFPIQCVGGHRRDVPRRSWWWSSESSRCGGKGIYEPYVTVVARTTRRDGRRLNVRFILFHWRHGCPSSFFVHLRLSCWFTPCPRGERVASTARPRRGRLSRDTGALLWFNWHAICSPRGIRGPGVRRRTSTIVVPVWTSRLWIPDSEDSATQPQALTTHSEILLVR